MFIKCALDRVFKFKKCMATPCRILNWRQDFVWIGGVEGLRRAAMMVGHDLMVELVDNTMWWWGRYRLAD
jgi:hypothetical protein